jgi:pantothenate kinase
MSLLAVLEKLPQTEMIFLINKNTSRTRKTLLNFIRSDDIVKSLLFLIANNIAQIGYLNARIFGVKRIFFSGGFLQENSYIWSRFSYSVEFWSKGQMDAMFLRHNSYLGALGALLEANTQ